MKDIIAVWGNTGAGKSLVSCALANALTAKGNNVIVINLDKLTPMFPVYHPFEEEKPEYSLGRLLSAPVTEDRLRYTIHIHPHNDHLAFMALLSTENGLSYQASWQTDTIHQLVQLLFTRDYADYVLFDCTSDVLSDNATLYALKNARQVVRVLSPDTRGITFSNVQMPIVQNGGMNTNHIVVLNNVFDYTPSAQIQKDYGFEHILPHCRDAYSKYIGGQLLKGLSDADGVQFSDTIQKIYQQVVTTDE